MPHRTAPSVARAELDQDPPDIATMRTTAHRLLAEHAEPVGPEQLETLWLALYGHMQLLAPSSRRWSSVCRRTTHRGPAPWPAWARPTCGYGSGAAAPRPCTCPLRRNWLGPSTPCVTTTTVWPVT